MRAGFNDHPLIKKAPDGAFNLHQVFRLMRAASSRSDRVVALASAGASRKAPAV